MKRIYIAAISALALSGGCARDNAVPVTGTDPADRPYVVIDGRMERTKAQIEPVDGLPAVQLPVGIVTVNHTTADPTTDQPGLEEWSGTTADLTRGYFGGPGINPPEVSNGEIAYTNEAGTAIQRTFYEDNGEYYFIRVCYPFLNAAAEPVADVVQTPGGAAYAISGLDGSQDVMCSNLAWGNVDNVLMKTSAAPDGNIVLSHMFSLFKVSVKAESEKAATQFGQIEDFVLRFQPTGVGIGMMNLDITPSREQTDYPMVGFAPFELYTVEDGVRVARPGVFDVWNGGALERAAETPMPAGYVMALPATGFRFEALTSDRLWVQANVSFATALDPAATSVPGTAYEVVITLMESYEVRWDVQPVEYWWLDSVFD